MSKDKNSPRNYQLPEENILKVHEDEPAYGFKWIPEIMSLSKSIVSPQQKELLALIVQLQDDGYCHASNDFFAYMIGVEPENKDNISKLVTQLWEKGLIRKKVIYERGTKRILQRRIWLTSRTLKLLSTPPVKTTVPPPVKSTEIIPKGIEVAKVLKRKKKNPPKDEPPKFGIIV